MRAGLRWRTTCRSTSFLTFVSRGSRDRKGGHEDPPQVCGGQTTREGFVHGSTFRATVCCLRQRERERRERERGERENEENRQSVRRARGRARARERERERGEQPRQARRRTACLSARPCGDVQRNNGMLDAIVARRRIIRRGKRGSCVAYNSTVTRPRSGATQSVRFRAPTFVPRRVPEGAARGACRGPGLRFSPARLARGGARPGSRAPARPGRPTRARPGDRQRTAPPPDRSSPPRGRAGAGVSNF